MLSLKRTGEIAVQVSQRLLANTSWACCGNKVDGYQSISVASYADRVAWELQIPVEALINEESLVRELEVQFAIKKVLISAGFQGGW